MICKRCGANNADDSIFCQHCGKRLGTTGLNESTVLSSVPIYALANGSRYNAYHSIEPGIPQQPGALAVAIATTDEQHSPIQARPQKSRRKRWILLTCLGLIVLLMAGAASYTYIRSYIYGNSSTPSKTLDTVCYAFKTGDFPTVYHQYSSGYQSQIGAEASWEAATKQDFSNQGGLMNCTYSNVQQNGSTGFDVMSLTFGNGYGSSTVETFQQTLIVENGAWKINSSTRLT